MQRQMEKTLGGAMKTITIAIVVASACLTNGLAPVNSFAQERVRIGVPLLPTVSYPVFIAHDKGFFEKNGIRAEIIRINS
jgi:ABC-type nitrate/sulfonate/bicarbonate transport system substrate-binding protein